MNILRLIGLQGLMASDAPLRHAAKCRRLKVAMRELIDMAGRLISAGAG